MFRRILVVLSTLILATGILATSIFRSSSVRYSFSPLTVSEKVREQESEKEIINYSLPDPGTVLPDHPLWPVLALKDRLLLLFARTPEEKAQVNQFLADERLVTSRKLFEEGKADIGFSTLTKAEKYLVAVLGFIRQAGERGVDVDELLKSHAQASLKHIETIEGVIEIAPEDAKPEISKIKDQPRDAFRKTRDAMNEKGIVVPNDPFGEE